MFSKSSEALNYVGPDSFKAPLYEGETMENGPLLPDVTVGYVDSLLWADPNEGF
ncbi:hypothetical protein M422DRAFT_254278 [Sphaerobolus stellatus SS14]|uniref:Uncharacterized protein n=1 Tax=Sphaerobolus stellatus (strain SS14) TaxID=990650 RepID=A0A0C9VLB1_SPHS4|nr:hypothetical protein M422DRAFT_254278 [Sphaerobolus stellatus SS14]